MLQQHQLRVAAVGKIILQEFEKSDPNVIKALAVHDLGNLVRINFSFAPEDTAPEGLEYWQNAQQEAINKYGTQDHIVTERMLQEIGIDEEIIKMVVAVDWKNIEKCLAGNDVSLMVLNYADMRVGPFGVLSATTRIDEVKKRKGDWPEYELIRKLVLELESKIFDGIKLKPEEINDTSVNALIPTISELTF